MGGSGAKNRRKQQRQTEEKDSRGTANRHDSRQRSPAKNVGRSFHSSGKTFHSSNNLHTKEKSKKPKHLKRKLEAVADDGDRERLLQELKTFERVKSNLSGPALPKKAKPSPVNEIMATGQEGAAIAPKDKTETKESRPSTSTVDISMKAAKKESEANTKQKKSNQSGLLSKKAKPSLEKEPITKEKSRSIEQAVTVANPKDQKETKEVKKESEAKTKPSRENEGMATGQDKNSASPKEKKVADSSKAAAKPLPAAKLPAEKDDDSSDSDSDSDESISAEEPRQRGKRRRGRQDTSKEILEKAPEEPTGPSSAQTDEPKKSSKEPDPSKKTMKKDDPRYCVGRTPVTDFSVGQKYDGTVVYIKPFGIFVDIGCHSDAFCHVSRLQDDFVESPEALFKPGDTVSARVVEIDRRKKRITVSLQSEARIADELLSVEAHAKRREKHRPPKNDQSMEKPETKSEVETKKKPVEQPTSRVVQPPSRYVPTKAESEMNPAELKRARKLARRAARREDQEGKGDDE